jgi:branched-chain amino acid transport system substrate-binding protein
VNGSKRSRVTRPIVVAMLTLGLLAGVSATATAGVSSADPLGKVNEATGSPVTLAWVTEGRSATVDNSFEIPMAKAVVKYANKYLNGFGGHVIKLFTCETKGDPATAQDCANQVVEKNVPLAMNAISAVPDSFVPTITGAGIPWVTYAAGSPSELFGPHAYSLSASILSIFGGVGADAVKKGYKRVAVVEIDVPNSTGALNGIAKPAFQAAGVTLDVIPVPAGTADVSPQVSAELAKDPDAFWVFGNDTFCIAATKAVKSLAAKLPIYALSNCLTPAFVKGIGSAKGMLTAATTDFTKNNDEVTLFRNIVKKYAKGYKADDQTVQAYASTLGVIRAMADLKGDPTAANVEATLQAAADVPLPVGGGITFSCNGTVKLAGQASNICSDQGLIATLDKNAHQSKVAPADLTVIFPA